MPDLTLACHSKSLSSPIHYKTNVLASSRITFPSLRVESGDGAEIALHDERGAMTAQRPENSRILRRLPVVCLLVALFRLLTGRLRFPRQYLHQEFDVDGDDTFRVFRHLKVAAERNRRLNGTTVLIVRFRFARFSQAVNRRLSLIPVLLIAGYPGFRHKIWMVSERTGEWQGFYEWESERAARDYTRSFVLGMMTRRAVSDSVSIRVVPDISAAEYLRRTGSDV